jgi:hypothetical protein
MQRGIRELEGRSIVERRNARTEAIVRDILRRRRVGECPGPGYDAGPSGGNLCDLPLETTIDFRLTGPAPAGVGRWLVHWLFVRGGMCVVVILGLCAYGLIGAILQQH